MNHTQSENSQNRSNAYPRVDFPAIAEQAVENFDAIIDALELDGENQGQEFVAYNPNRRDQELGSFKINRQSGLWADFALDEAAGNDLISLVAYVKNVTQVEAARWIQKLLAGEHAQPGVGGVQPPSTDNPIIVTKKRAKTEDGATNGLVCPVPDNAPELPEAWFPIGRASARYTYRDRSGRVMMHVLRFESNGSKDFRPATLYKTVSGALQWRLKGLPEPRPLFNLDRLAQNPDAKVVVVEGEKCAEAAATLFPRCVTTTSMNGAKSPEKTDWTPLAGRNVYIWPDNDAAGEAYAEAVTEILHSLHPAANVWVLRKFDLLACTNADGNPSVSNGFDAPKGYDAADALAEGWTAGHGQLLFRFGHFTEIIVLPEELEKVEPEHEYLASIHVEAGRFQVTDHGVFQIKETADGDFRYVWLASRIDVLGVARDQDAHGWCYLLRVHASDSGYQDVLLPAEYLTGGGDKASALLLDHGARLEGKTRSTLFTYIQVVPTEAYFRVVKQTGWLSPSCFVLPNHTVGQYAEKILYRGQGGDLYTSQGSYDAWRTKVAARCEGNSRLVLALCVALTGPFLRVLGEDNGGFHIRGNSSIGKSVCLQVAASVWGSKNFVNTWRATDNGLEGVALAHNDTLIALDELAQVSPLKAGESAYMLMNGQGKVRAGNGGETRPVAQWRLMALSTGEISLADHMAEGNCRTMAGQEVRLLDIPADAGCGLGLFENLHGLGSAREFADSIKADALAYFGTAGTSLVYHLCDDLADTAFIANMQRHINDLSTRMGSSSVSGQVQRAIKRFAMVAIVGEYAIAQGVLPWAQGSAVKGVGECMVAWLKNRGGDGLLEKKRALDQVRDFIVRHGMSRFQLWSPAGVSDNTVDWSERVNDRAGFRKLQEGEQYRYFVLPDAFKNELCKGYDPKQVKDWLIEEGWLAVDGKGQAPTAHRLPGLGSTRAYVLLPKMFADADAGTQDTDD